MGTTMPRHFDGPFGGGPFGGGFGGPFGGHHGGPFGGHRGWQGPEMPKEFEAMRTEMFAFRQQLGATMTAAQGNPATLAKVQQILAQARVALATLSSQTPTQQAPSEPTGDAPSQV